MKSQTNAFDYNIRYCILTRETHKSDEELRAPNQCALDMTLRKHDKLIHRKCFNKEQNDR